MASDEHRDEPRNALVAAPQNTELRAPNEWADVLFPAGDNGRQHPARFKHGAAAALHGWDLHQYNTGEPMKLSRADYEAAIQAATVLDENTGAPVPHAPARSDTLPEPEQPKKEEVKP